jgi:hypothetical protein
LVVGTANDFGSAITGGILSTGAASGAVMDSGTFMQQVDAVSSDVLSGAGTALMLAAPALTATSGSSTTGIAANAEKGALSEANVLKDIGETKNTKSVSSAEGKSIPDFQNTKTVGEIKDAKQVSNTKQLRIQKDAAQASGRQHELHTGTKTNVSKNAAKGTNVIRRDDLGPK